MEDARDSAPEAIVKSIIKSKRAFDRFRGRIAKEEGEGGFSLQQLDRLSLALDKWHRVSALHCIRDLGIDSLLGQLGLRQLITEVENEIDRRFENERARLDPDASSKG